MVAGLLDSGWITQAEGWSALAALLLLEIVLGVDNVVFISILANKLPADQQPRARRTGLLLAGGMRVLFLLGIGVILGLKKTLFEVAGVEFSGKSLVLLLGGLAGDAANKVKGAGAHSRSSGTFLTCVPFQAVTDTNVLAATTMDQLVAKSFGRETELRSIELGLESADVLGACDGASCALTNTIAWSGPSTPLPIDNDPRSVFERLFGASGSTDPAARLARLRRNQSMLDAVTKQIARLNSALGPRDQAKFDEFLESIRDVERRLDKAKQQSSRELPVVDRKSVV